MSNDEIKLSICVVTYNHGKYIAQALDSFLMQKTNFKFQVIIGDDASTDNTQDILREYAAKYPDIIKPVLREKNIQAINNSLDVYSRANTEYVAICDGDDYWTDENKLQMQVDFLELNPKYAICFHPTRIMFEDQSNKDVIYPSKELRFEKSAFTLDDLATRNPMHTNSLVYRWRFSSGNIKEYMPNDICPGDYFLALLHAEQGDIGFIDRVMSVYRVNSGGMSFDLHKKPDLVWLKYGFEELNFHRAVEKHFKYRLSKYFRKSLVKKSKDILNAFVMNGAFDKLEKYKNDYPEYFYLALEKDENEVAFEKMYKLLKHIWGSRRKVILAALGMGVVFAALFGLLLVLLLLRLL